MSIHATHQKKADEPAEEFEYAAVNDERVNVRNVEKDTVYTVTTTTDGTCALECTCPDYRYRQADKIGGRCKHMAGVEDTPDSILEDDQDDEPEITYHVEPDNQGGAQYARCERCGVESVFGEDSIVHRDGC